MTAVRGLARRMTAVAALVVAVCAASASVAGALVVVSSCAINNCDVNAACTDTGGGTFRCDCNKGYTGSGVTCGDINECQTGAHNCHADADCANSVGSFKCDCKRGFTGDGVSSCADIDDCNPNPCANRGTCTDTGAVSFKCTCVGGYAGVTCRNNADACNAPVNNNDPLPTIFYNRGIGSMLTTDCGLTGTPQRPLSLNCKVPDYVLGGTAYWDVGSRDLHPDKLAPCSQPSRSY